MKQFYMVIQEESRVGHNKYYYAYVMDVNTSDNIVKKLNKKQIITANIYSSKKEATEVVRKLNEGFKKNDKHILEWSL